MDNKRRIALNILSLRTAFGETQETLGAALGENGVGKTTISNYENGIRHPERETLEKIAKHYFITVDDLMTNDYSNIRENSIDVIASGKAFVENIDVFFPIVKNNKALDNDCFKETVKLHEEIYDLIRQGFNFSDETMVGFSRFMENYSKLYEEDNSNLDSAANFVSLFLLLGYIWKTTPELVKIGDSAFFEQLKSKDNKAYNEFNKHKTDFLEAAESMAEVLEDKELVDEIIRIRYDLKHSLEYADIADYHLAIAYLFNLVNENLSVEFSNKIGFELIISFCSVGNEYAKKYLEYYIKHSFFGESSHNVDDN